MPKPVDLSSPALRREALQMVDVGDPHPHHAMLREIFDLEWTWREGPDSGESDEYEQIYVTAFLLFRIGDPADSCRLYAAKFRTGDMDLGIGVDAQAIFGAGRHETLRWLLVASGLVRRRPRTSPTTSHAPSMIPAGTVA